MMPLTSFCTIDTWIELLKPLSLALSLSCLAVYGGMLFLAFALLRLSQRKRLSAYIKGARQLSLLGLVFGWLLLVAFRVWLYFFPAQHLENCWMAMAGIVLLQSAHYAFWKKLAKPHATLLAWLVLFSGLLSFSTAMMVSFLLRLQIATVLPLCQATWGVFSPFIDLQIFKENPLYLYVVSTTIFSLLVLSVPAAWGAFCLPLLKKYQDFGRDHYKALVAWCSLWARNAWTLLWVVQCSFVLAGNWLFWQETGSLNTTYLTIEAVCQLCWLTPVLLWQRAYKSEQPLRHKIALFVAVIFSISLF